MRRLRERRGDAEGVQEAAGRNEADPEWEELAAATAGFSSVTGRMIMNPQAVAPVEFESAGRRLQAAAAAAR